MHFKMSRLPLVVTAIVLSIAGLMTTILPPHTAVVRADMSRVSPGKMLAANLAPQSRLLAMNGGLTHPDSAPPKDFTLTLVIRPQKSEFSTSVWGKVRSEKGVCADPSCGYRVHHGETLHFTEITVNAKKHRFLYWILPNGKHATSKKIAVKVNASEAVTSKFK